MNRENIDTKAVLAQASASIDVARGDLDDVISPRIAAVLHRVFRMGRKGVQVTEAGQEAADRVNRAAWAVVAAVAELDEAICELFDDNA